MHPGMEYNCPVCGKNTFLKKITLMEGWTKKGEALACAGCSRIVEELAAGKNREASSSPPPSSSDALKALLGGDFGEKHKEIKEEKGDKNFCRDCAHLLAHPFLVRCMKFSKDVNPMDDCPFFSPKKNK